MKLMIKPDTMNSRFSNIHIPCEDIDEYLNTKRKLLFCATHALEGEDYMRLKELEELLYKNTEITGDNTSSEDDSKDAEPGLDIEITSDELSELLSLYSSVVQYAINSLLYELMDQTVEKHYLDCLNGSNKSGHGPQYKDWLDLP